MVDFVTIGGCPGSGKTTVSRLIYNNRQETWPLIDYAHLRTFHLNRQWTNQSGSEEQMTFENLIFIL
jgi:adenylate kinase family enzyme